MKLFQVKKGSEAIPPEIEACDNEIHALEQRRQSVYQSIGERYAKSVPQSEAGDTPYEPELLELEKIAERMELLKKRKLSVQGLRSCEHCGAVLNIDSSFCNSCGQKLAEVEPEVFTDGPLCPNCKALVEPGVSFCNRCGAKLEPQSQEAALLLRICPSCGFACEPDTTFCTKCGTKLQN